MAEKTKEENEVIVDPNNYKAQSEESQKLVRIIVAMITLSILIFTICILIMTVRAKKKQVATTNAIQKSHTEIIKTI